MKWQVRLSKRAVKNYQKLPQQIQAAFKIVAEAKESLKVVLEP